MTKCVSLRGGSWDFNPRYCLSAHRYRSHPDARYTPIGFRVVCVAPRRPIDQVLLRGGSCRRFPWYCRSAYRNWLRPDGRNYSIGFRVCCPTTKSGETK